MRAAGAGSELEQEPSLQQWEPQQHGMEPSATDCEGEDLVSLASLCTTMMRLEAL